MAAHLGAHEVMEIHEVLLDTIDGINKFQMFAGFIRDGQLHSILDKHLQFMTQEYNNTVQALNNMGYAQAIPYRNSMPNYNPSYGLNNPAPHSPRRSAQEIDDRDIAFGMLSTHKSSAIRRMMASLECADPQIREIIQQGAINCSQQAYDVWSFMNQRGFYQVPTMKERTTGTVLSTYTPTSGSRQAMQNQQMM